MTNPIMLIILAAVAGVAVTLQGQFMGLMDKTIGTKESVFITYFFGGLLALLPILFSKGGNLAAWKILPWYALTTGVLGIIIVSTIGYTIPRLGLSTALTIIVAAQLIVAALLDHFGLLGATLRPLDLSRFVGIGFLISGVWLIMK